MTVLTKLGLSEKKDQLPLVDEKSRNEATVEIGDTQEVPQDDNLPNLIIIRKKKDARLNNLCCILLCGLLVTSIGILGGMQMYIQHNRSSQQHHYKGWCAIPYDNSEQDPKLIEQHFGIMAIPPITITLSLQDVELLDDASSADVPADEDALPNNYLKEKFDINDNVERIVVEHSDGHHTDILHDFSANYSGIIDTDRCFVMTLDTQNVMQPNMFVKTVQGQSDFDLTTVSITMHALLPALTDLSGTGPFIEKECSDRPTFILKMMPAGTIRKRSADARPAQFVHFSGRHVQEIEIDNMDALLDYEKKTSAV